MDGMAAATPPPSSQWGGCGVSGSDNLEDVQAVATGTAVQQVVAIGSAVQQVVATGTAVQEAVATGIAVS